MNFNNISFLKDGRVGGVSISTTVCLGEYIAWFKEFGLANKLDEQRPVMKTRTANMIRRRLVEDLKQGAIIPPIVIGFAVENVEEYTESDDKLIELLAAHIRSATVIDGMQRSEALSEALDSSPAIANHVLRLDIWIMPNAISLIYRMLVLNTGQTPWDLKRQMEVVYKPLIDECKHFVNGIVINHKNDARRRCNGGEYPASSIVELFLAFSSKKELLNTSDKLADDFTRLDVTQMTGTPERSQMFYECMSMLYRFDVAVSRYNGNESEELEGDKICCGRDLFTNMPAKVGFIVALAQAILGRTGTDKTLEEQTENLHHIQTQFDAFCSKIEQYQMEELEQFLAFGVLNDALKSLSVKKIGDEQRKYYRTGFETLIQSDFKVENLIIVWRAY